MNHPKDNQKYHVTRKKSREIVLEGETLEAFIRLYALYQIRKIQELFGIGRSSVLRIAKRLGIDRDYQSIKRHSIEERINNIKKDRLRVRWGLEPVSRLRLFRTLTSSGYRQKFLMIRHNNYFRCREHTTYICYDSATRRSERREKTAIRHGLKIINAESINITRP